MTWPFILNGARPLGTLTDDLPLTSVADTRVLERHLCEVHTPAHALMARAGLSLARWVRACTPHARRVLVVCGPGGNGGDGLYAASYLREAGVDVQAWLVGRSADRRPSEDRPLEAAAAAGVPMKLQAPAAGEEIDAVVDAVLGIGTRQPLASGFEDAVRAINAYRERGATVLSADVPTGLDADHGTTAGVTVQADATLSLLTLKVGLWTANGRRCSGEVWWDPLVEYELAAQSPRAWLAGLQSMRRTHRVRDPSDHKGSMGDVLLVGGASGMSGAAWLAARAALGAGAGRVYVHWLGEAPPVDGSRPELMRWTQPLGAGDTARATRLTVVCGCGGGQEVREELPWVLAHSPRLVLDADALNVLAQDPQLQTQLQSRHRRGRPTVLTPHPLEAARLLGCTVADVQSDRLRHAQHLADHLQVTVVLKGSGTVIACPGEVPRINSTGSATLASAGTGDVLAGWMGGWWSQSPQSQSLDVACAAVWLHGQAGQCPPVGSAQGFQALELIDHMRVLREHLLNGA